jgi:sulfite reductase alpha subunit-like flavoprotein
MQVAKQIDAALEKQGAKRLVPCGLGDDDQCIDDDFTAWYVSFLANSADPMLPVHHEC